MERVCFLLRVRPERLEEYRARHRAVWPEMLDALRATGWGNYSLFLDDDGLLVGYVETEDFAAAVAGMEATDVNARWQAEMAEFFELPVGRAPGHGPAPPRGGVPPCLSPRYAAVDLGATSGRVFTGRLQGGRVALEEVHRFDNRPVRCPTACAGTSCTCSRRRSRGCAARGRSRASASTPGASTTRCSTRAAACSACRSTTATRARTGMVERAFARVPAAELYAATGIQTLPINTVFQLLADEGSAALAAAERHRARPRPARVLAQRRAGQRVHERVDDRAARRAQRRSGRASSSSGSGSRPGCSATLVEPGTALGPLLGHHELGPRAGLRRREPRHRLGVRRRARARRARGDPLERHLVAARARAARAGARATRRARRTSPTSAASTARRGCSRTSWACGCSRSAGARGRRAARRPPTRSCTRLAESVEGDVPLFDPDDEAFLAPGRHARADRRRLRALGPGRAARRRHDRARHPASRSPASTAG